jgi:hypothetical protein
MRRSDDLLILLIREHHIQLSPRTVKSLLTSIGLLSNNKYLSATQVKKFRKPRISSSSKKVAVKRGKVT